eukprot:GILI01039910.1.p1 GENE.GILI01039910.1~~GILI01039910.1.p1  ORF type:complete len:142 (-),score=22.17 GILI01039910.1:297-722(-)
MSTMHLLIRNGANVCAATSTGDTVLHLIARGAPAAACEALLAAGADIDAANSTGATPLHDAVRYLMSGKVTTLLALGARVGAGTTKERKSLHHAIQRGSIRSLKALIDHGADLEDFLPTLNTNAITNLLVVEGVTYLGIAR